MTDILLNYFFPFFAFAAIWFLIAMRVRWLGGSAMMVVVFGAVAFGPSLVYAAIADDSSLALYGCSVIAAIAIIGMMIFIKGRGSRRKLG